MIADRFKKNTIIRIVGNNLKGGARLYCLQLNEKLENCSFHTITFIPRAPSDDTFSDAEKVPYLYCHTINFVHVISAYLKHRNDLFYVHLHLPNMIKFYGFIFYCLRVPYVITFHTPSVSPKKISSYIGEYLMSFVAKHSKCNLFVSRFIMAEYLEKTLKYIPLIRADSKNCKVIYNGSDSKTKIHEFKTKSNTKELRICIVGELTHRKGITEYISIFSGLSRVFSYVQGCYITFNFYGDGPMVDLVQSYRRRFNCSNIAINWCGYEDNHDKIYLTNDIHMIISRGEPFGRVITEAMAYGVPSLAINDGAFREIIQNGYNGYVCDTHDEIVDKIKEFLVDQDLLLTMSRNALFHFKTHFTKEVFVAKTMKTIHESL